MTGLGLLLAALGVLTWPAPRRPSRLDPTPQPPVAVAGPVSPARRRVSAAAVGLVLAAAVGGVVGLVSALVASVLADRLLSRADGGDAREVRRRREEALPGAVDLLCVCLDAGLPPGAALALVAPGVAAALRGDLTAVCALHELGADAASAWAEWRADPVLGAVARTMIRSGHSGSALAAALRAVSGQCRADLNSRAEATARRAGVFVLAPLGLCFLPAFVCLGVVPTVLGIAATVLP